MDGQALIVRGNGLRLPLRDGSVDTVITSPPYFALRAYSAGPGEIGSEPTPQLFLEALWAATAEMARVLKPTGSIFVNLGDKYGRPGGGADVSARTLDGIGQGATQRLATPAGVGRDKSLMLLPERYRIGCVDRLGLIARAVIVWDKPNGLPESVTDRVRRSHEDWVHLTKQPRYYSATDEIREAYSPASVSRYAYDFDAGPEGGTNGKSNGPLRSAHEGTTTNPLGKLPGSVWSIPSEPLTLPGYFTFEDGVLLDFLAPERGGHRPRANGHHPGLFDPDPFIEHGEDAGAWRWMRATGVTSSPWPQTDVGLQLRTAASHYAAFPSRWPEQLIKGFSPPGICVACGQGRVPVVARERVPRRPSQHKLTHAPPGQIMHGSNGGLDYEPQATILGYACACTPHTDHPGSGERHANTPPEGRQGNTLSMRWSGGDLHDKPRVGPWREYHLDRWTPPPTRPAVILDPFSGTGTTPMVARALGRIGIGVDLSAAYCRAARWRARYGGDKAISRTNLERQGQLL